MTGPAEPTRKLVPAVRQVLAIFDFLRQVDNKPQSLSSIARGAELNVSTCFNVLKTLETGHLIAFDPSTKEYRLGMGLGELGSLADVGRQSRQIAMVEARRVANEVGLGCFLLTFTKQEEFVVLDKVDSRNPIRTTIDIGATFPTVGTLAAKAWYAWQPDAVIDDIVQRHSLRAYTEHSITSTEVFKAELAIVRERGYATSEGEYYPDHNAVAATMYGWDGSPEFIFIVVGTTSQLCEPKLTRVGEEVARAADYVTKQLNGRHPRDTS